jgi:hypothetical protein
VFLKQSGQRDVLRIVRRGDGDVVGETFERALIERDHEVPLFPLGTVREHGGVLFVELAEPAAVKDFADVMGAQAFSIEGMAREGLVTGIPESCSEAAGELGDGCDSPFVAGRGGEHEDGS